LVNFLVSALNWVWSAAIKGKIWWKKVKGGKGFAMNLQVSKPDHKRETNCAKMHVSFFNVDFVYYFEPALLALGMPNGN
jgi:hypothetical protein